MTSVPIIQLEAMIRAKAAKPTINCVIIFLVPEIVTAKSNDPKLIDELFSAVLAEEKLNLMLWWIDQKDDLYASINTQLSWGLFHKLVGAHPVDVVERRNPNSNFETKTPVFVTAFDMI